MADHEPAQWTPDSRQLSEVYGLPFGSVREAVPGVNWTFETWRGDEQFFLRLYPTTGRSRAQIDFEIAALRHANGKQTEAMAVSQPVAASGGRYLVELQTPDGPRLACLFAAAKGREPELTDDDLSGFGKAVAELHIAMDGFRHEPARPLLPADLAANTKRLLAARGPAFDPLVELLDKNDRLLRTGTTGQYFCHGDARLGNARIDGGRVTFFDFDDCGNGPAAFDLSTMAWWLWSTERAQAAFKWQRFVGGYAAKKPVSDAAIESIPTLVMLNEVRSLYFLAFHDLLSAELWDMQRSRSLELFGDWLSGRAAAEMKISPR